MKTGVIIENFSKPKTCELCLFSSEVEGADYCEVLATFIEDRKEQCPLKEVKLCDGCR